MKIQKILVSQPRPATDKSPYFDIAEKFGVQIDFRPFVKVEGITAREFRSQKIDLTDYTAVIFNSRNAADNFFRLCEEMRVNVPDTMKYFCTTEAIALYLQKYIVYRKRKIFFGTSGKLDDPQLSAAIMKNKTEKFLFPVADVHKIQAAYLDDGTVDCTKSMMFRTVSNDFEPDEPRDYDLMLVFSPAGVASLLKNFPDFKENGQPIEAAAMGTATVKAAKEAGLRLAFEVPAPNVPSMPAGLQKFLRENQE